MFANLWEENENGSYTRGVIVSHKYDLGQARQVQKVFEIRAV